MAHLSRRLRASMEVANNAIAWRPNEPGVFGLMQSPLQALQFTLRLQVSLKGSLFPIHPKAQQRLKRRRTTCHSLSLQCLWPSPGLHYWQKKRFYHRLPMHKTCPRRPSFLPPLQTGLPTYPPRKSKSPLLQPSGALLCSSTARELEVGCVAVEGCEAVGSRLHCSAQSSNLDLIHITLVLYYYL